MALTKDLSGLETLTKQPTQPTVSGPGKSLQSKRGGGGKKTALKNIIGNAMEGQRKGAAPKGLMQDVVLKRPWPGKTTPKFTPKVYEPRMKKAI
jgi:hypothetical protein